MSKYKDEFKKYPQPELYEYSLISPEEVHEKHFFADKTDKGIFAKIRLLDQAKKPCIWKDPASASTFLDLSDVEKAFVWDFFYENFSHDKKIDFQDMLPAVTTKTDPTLEDIKNSILDEFFCGPKKVKIIEAQFKEEEEKTYILVRFALPSVHFTKIWGRICHVAFEYDVENERITKPIFITSTYNQPLAEALQKHFDKGDVFSDMILRRLTAQIQEQILDENFIATEEIV